MHTKLFLNLKFLAIFLFGLLIFAETCIDATTKTYLFEDDPIDVVIPSTDKDLETLDMCIDGIRANCPQVNRIIVVSKKWMTRKAEWFNEASFPFTKNDVALQLLGGDKKAANKYLKATSRVGWYYQQLLKLYAPLIIPGISSNVLILDSDTIFLRPVEFLDAENGGLYNPGAEYHHPYFTHAACFLPGLKRLNPEYSGISHHMLFQRAVLDDLFQAVEDHHHMHLWEVFCRCVNHGDLHYSGASEYEIYFNFVFSQTDQVHLRHLQWTNIGDLNNLEHYKEQGYDYVSCHAWMRSN